MLSVVGCSTYPVADPVNLKNGRTQNNAALNNSALVDTAFVTREDLGRYIENSIPEVAHAEVLVRSKAVFVGVMMRPSPAQSKTLAATAESHALANNTTHHPKMQTRVSTVPVPKAVVAKVSQAVHHVVPDAKRVYVTSDQTLSTHFHMFSSDRATDRDTGSDMILDDISRVFPGYS